MLVAFFGGPTFSMPLRRAPERPEGSGPPLRGLLRYGFKTKSAQYWTLSLVDDLLNAVEKRS